ncbi:hypothetical protein LBMAG53_18790 [Planctomycetota bacterium]|nr:hypothetical protein LBMAG53_18790 [Planctomycetota bacterium]
MNPSIAALLDLLEIDRRRQGLRKDRDTLRTRADEAAKMLAAAEAAAAAAQAEVDKVDALLRQYQSDLARCDAAIAEARSRQQAAKTNKEYMAIINSIEQAKSEKVMREQSLKELGARIDALKTRANQGAEKAAAARAALEQALAAATGNAPTEIESSAQAEYDEKKKLVDPAFLEQYERLVKAHHKTPLLRIDPKTRATPVGSVISHNLCEQIRMGKLVIDRLTNAILYLPD